MASTSEAEETDEFARDSKKLIKRFERGVLYREIAGAIIILTISFAIWLTIATIVIFILAFSIL